MTEMSTSSQSDHVTHSPTTGTFSVGEQLTVVALYCLVTLYQFCLSYIWIGDDCRGPGAAFPGGCREYTATVTSRFHALFLVQFLLLVLLFFIFLRRCVERKYRLLALVLYILFLFFGQLLVYLPPLPAK